MRFVEWRKWLSRMNWYKRWFIYLILIRPIVDLFYSLKSISPFFSPLYIVGGLTIILLLLSLGSGTLKRVPKSKIDSNFVILFTLTVANVLFILFIDTSLDSLGDALRYSMPFLLFFYLRRFVSSRDELDGILYTMLLAAIFPLLMITYEVVFGPISASAISITRGGGVRYEGGYADVMNYAIYLMSSYLIIGYFSMEKTRRNLQIVFMRKLFFIFPVIMIGLIKIRHTSTWAVFLMISGIYVVFRFINRKISLPFIFVIILMMVFSQNLIESSIKPLLAKDIRVAEGEENIDRSFNGRMIRWKNAFSIWNEVPFFSKLIGSPSIVLFENIDTFKFEESNKDISAIPKICGGGTHNEFLRMLFLCGIAGLLLFLNVVFIIIKKSFKYDKQQQYLILGITLMLTLYSISTNPLIYQPLLYIVLPVFAFASRPINGKDRKA